MLNFSLHRPETGNSNRLFNWLSIRSEFSLSIVLLISVSRILTGGFSFTVAIMLTGSVISIAVLHALSKGVRARLLTKYLCYIPYLLGLYIFFVEGFWRLTQTLRDFSIWQPGLAIFYFIVGYFLASTGYTAITQGKRLSEGH